MNTFHYNYLVILRIHVRNHAKSFLFGMPGTNDEKCGLVDLKIKKIIGLEVVLPT